MRPRLILLLIFAIGAMASSAWLIMKSSSTKVSCQECQKKNPAKKIPLESGSGDELFNSSFNHFIVSTIK